MARNEVYKNRLPIRYASFLLNIFLRQRTCVRKKVRAKQREAENRSHPPVSLSHLSHKIEKCITMHHSCLTTWSSHFNRIGIALCALSLLLNSHLFSVSHPLFRSWCFFSSVLSDITAKMRTNQQMLIIQERQERSVRREKMRSRTLLNECYCMVLWAFKISILKLSVWLRSTMGPIIPIRCILCAHWNVPLNFGMRIQNCIYEIA